MSLTPFVYPMTVDILGAVTPPSCARYALRKTAEDNKQYYMPEGIDTILSNFSVDDYLKSVATKEEAILLIQDLTAACERGGFHLSTRVSNSRLVLSSIPEPDRTREIRNLDLDKDKLPLE